MYLSLVDFFLEAAFGKVALASETTEVELSLLCLDLYIENKTNMLYVLVSSKSLCDRELKNKRSIKGPFYVLLIEN